MHYRRVPGDKGAEQSPDAFCRVLYRCVYTTIRNHKLINVKTYRLTCTGRRDATIAEVKRGEYLQWKTRRRTVRNRDRFRTAEAFR